MRLQWQEGMAQGHPIPPPFKTWAGFVDILIQKRALLGFVSFLSFTTNPQEHVPEPHSARFHTELSLM